MLKMIGGKLLGVVTGGAGISTYLAIALVLSLAFGAWQLARVSDRDETIGAQGEIIKQRDAVIAAREGELADERSARLRDRAMMALNLRNYTDTIRHAELLADERRRLVRRLEHAKPIPPDLETLCRPVRDAFNSLAPWLLDRLAGGGKADAGAAGNSGAGADPGLPEAGAHR